jgi:hypothetical protein
VFLRTISAPASKNVQSAAVDLSDCDRPAFEILAPEYFEQALSIKGPGESLMADSLAQNIPFGLARGMFGAINGAEFFGSPTTCKVSQCSIALPSASIL